MDLARYWISRLKKPAFVIARRAKPDVAIQSLIDSIDYLDCFAALAITILLASR
jgi:hypothetical protein